MGVTYISNKKEFLSKSQNAKLVYLLCGFGGKIWQLRRLITTLNNHGYDVVALEFAKSVLSSGDHTQLLDLTNEVDDLLINEQHKDGRPALLIGVSLGALLSLNLLRRSNNFHEAILITGGDIAKIARKLYPRAWPQSELELQNAWKSINMYSNPAQPKGKRALFVLHPSIKLIDVTDTRQEIVRLQEAGIVISLVERSKFDHVGTIIEETVIFPKRTLAYITQIQS